MASEDMVSSPINGFDFVLSIWCKTRGHGVHETLSTFISNLDYAIFNAWCRKWLWQGRKYDNDSPVFQDQSSCGAIPAQRLFPLVGAKAMHRQGALQDHHARGLQRAPLLPPANGRVHGVCLAPGEGGSGAGSRHQDAGKPGTEGRLIMSRAGKKGMAQREWKGTLQHRNVSL